MKNALLFLLIVMIIFPSCSSKESRIYDTAVAYVKDHLKAPSSAKFESFNNSIVSIIDSAGVGNPFKEMESSFDDTTHLYDDYDNTIYSTSVVKLNYEAQNSFGVFLKNSCMVYLKKWKYKDNSGQWEVFHVDYKNK